MSETPQHNPNLSEADHKSPDGTKDRVTDESEAHEIAKKVDKLESERAYVLGGLAIVGRANVERPRGGGLKYSVEHIANEMREDSKNRTYASPEDHARVKAEDLVTFATVKANKENEFGFDPVWEKTKEYAGKIIDRTDTDLNDIYETGYTKAQQERKSDAEDTIEILRKRAV